MRIILATCTAALLLLGGCDTAPQEPRVTVEDARVQLPAMEGRPGVAYFTLRTNNDPSRLVSIASPRIERIELHETIVEGGVSRMRPAQDLSFADSLRFEPGGAHAMLFGIDPSLRPGDRVSLTFNVEPLPPVTVEADVQGPGGGHSGH